MLLISALLLFAGACHKTVAIATAPSTDYIDLARGGSLAITVPYLASGNYVAKTDAIKEQGTTLTLAASDLIGYQVVHFKIKGAKNGQVRLQFEGTDTTKDGKTNWSASLPTLPFSLPRSNQYVRLIYFIRKSHADHNMAIVASKDPFAIARLTQQIKANPDLCQSDLVISCVWVPAGIAVSPE